MSKSGQPAKNKKVPQTERSSRSNVSSAFLENSQFLKNFLKRFLSRAEDIEDVTQEAYLNAFRAEQERGIEHPKAYLFRVAKNLALNELNRKSEQMTVYIEDRIASIPLDGGDCVEDEVEAQQSIALYYEAVAALPMRCRRVFLLRKVNGMSHKEIASQLDITLSAVEKHLRNGAKRCRAHINRANGDIAQKEKTLVGSALTEKVRLAQSVSKGEVK